MTGRSIGDALREWADEKEHEEFIKAARTRCSWKLGTQMRPGLREELQQEIDVLHSRFSDQAGRQLRRIKVWIDADRNTLHLSLEPYDSDLMSVRLLP